jgi:arylsulfatase A-like enzyme
LRRIPNTQRYFLWVHLFGTHYPNAVHEGVRLDGSSMEDGYDHELRYMDLQLKDLLALLARRDPRPVVMITGDHGESIAPWMRSHGFLLDEPTMRVPLLIQVPGISARAVDATVSLVDLFPTILGFTRTPGPHDLDGIDLGALLRGGSAPSPRYVVTDCWRFAPNRQPFLNMIGASDGKRVIYHDLETGLVTFPPSGQTPGYSLPAWRALEDPLARFAIGYAEEQVPLPR